MSVYDDLQDAHLRVWPHHRAAVRDWLIRLHPTAAGIDPRRAMAANSSPSGFGPGPGDLARVNALMGELGVDLDAPLGRALVVWAMSRGAGGGEPKLHSLVRRIRRAMRNAGVVSEGAESYTIRSYKEVDWDGLRRKYAIRVDSD